MLVAVTGNMGAGKTTLAGMLESLGARRVDADLLARQVVEESAGLRDRLADAFGRDLLDGEGGLDRRGLARRALADEQGRRRLEGLVRPELEPRIWRALRAAEAGGGIVLLDAPLVFEWGLQNRFDAVILVKTRSGVAAERVSRDRGIGPEEVRQRRSVQQATAPEGAVDFEVHNDRDLQVLRTQAARVWEGLQRMHSGREA
jgi:dephospho-CoA kinase